MLYHVQGKGKRNLISTVRDHHAVSSRPEALWESPYLTKVTPPDVEPGEKVPPWVMAGTSTRPCLRQAVL